VDTQTKKYMPNKVRRRKVRDARLEAEDKRRSNGKSQVCQSSLPGKLVWWPMQFVAKR
jgi:hypothetical protein